MNIEMVVGIGKDAIFTLLMMGAPMLITGAFIGIFMSMVQTVTQLKDQSITFIPKIVGVFLVLVVATPFMIRVMVRFTNHLYTIAGELGRLG